MIHSCWWLTKVQKNSVIVFTGNLPDYSKVENVPCIFIKETDGERCDLFFNWSQWEALQLKAAHSSCVANIVFAATNNSTICKA